MAINLDVRDLYLAPNRNGPPQADVLILWLQNPAALDILTYGTRIPVGVLAHDHGARRGLRLRDELGQGGVGPYGTLGGAVGSWQEGIPILPPVVGETFTTRAKLLAWWPIFLRGGVKSLNVDFLVFLDGAGARSLTFKAQLRDSREAGLEWNEGHGPTATTTITTGGGTVAGYFRGSFTFADTSRLGPVAIDREHTILEVWLASDPPGGSGYRFLAVLPYDAQGAPGNGGAEPLEWFPDRAQIEASDLAVGHLALSDHAARAHTRGNELLAQALGSCPALEQDLLTPRDNESWQRKVRRYHRHQGRRLIDPLTGEITADGACIRRQIWAATFVDDIAQNGAQMTAAFPNAGLLIHPAGVLNTNSGWVDVEARLDLELGLGAIEIDFGVVPGNSDAQARLTLRYFFADGDHQLLPGFGVGSSGAGVPRSFNPGGGGNYTTLEVEPVDGPAWIPAAQRAGLGQWTLGAARTPAPTNIRSLAQTPRVAQGVRIYLTPKLTGLHRLNLRWALEQGARGSGVYDVGARVVFAAVYAPGGF